MAKKNIKQKFKEMFKGGFVIGAIIVNEFFIIISFLLSYLFNMKTAAMVMTIWGVFLIIIPFLIIIFYKEENDEWQPTENE